MFFRQFDYIGATYLSHFYNGASVNNPDPSPHSSAGILENIDKNKEITHIHYNDILLEREDSLHIGFNKFCQKILLIFIYAVSKTLFKSSIESKENAGKIIKGPLIWK